MSHLLRPWSQSNPRLDYQKPSRYWSQLIIFLYLFSQLGLGCRDLQPRVTGVTSESKGEELSGFLQRSTGPFVPTGEPPGVAQTHVGLSVGSVDPLAHSSGHARPGHGSGHQGHCLSSLAAPLSYIGILL